MQIDISAEQVRQVLGEMEDSLYASWRVAEVTVGETVTTVELALSGFDDSEYLDFSPVFQIVAEANQQFGERLWIREVHFNPRSVSGTVVLKTEEPPTTSSPSRTAQYDVATRFCILDGTDVSNIEYTDPPLLVGYTAARELCLE